MTLYLGILVALLAIIILMWMCILEHRKRIRAVRDQIPILDACPYCDRIGTLRQLNPTDSMPDKFHPCHCVGCGKPIWIDFTITGWKDTPF